MGKIKVSVPATTANLGPGFDTLGCALRLYNTFTFELTDSGLIITGCDKKYAGPDNLCYTAFRKTYEKLGLPLPPGLKIDIDALVPVSRGLAPLFLWPAQWRQITLREALSRKKTFFQ